MSVSKLNIEGTVFYEKVNVKKLVYILNNRLKYENIINEEEKEMRRHDKNYNAYASLQKLKDNIIIPPELENTEYGLIKVQYQKGRNSNGIGRWYCKNGVGVQPCVSCVRGTICDGIWTDIDQDNSHPTLFRNKLGKHSLTSPILEKYIKNREDILKIIMKQENCSRNNAKTMVIAVINGAKYSSPFLKSLYDELKPLITFINDLDEYKYIKDYVKKTYPNHPNLSGKIISRILQVMENELLETHIEFFTNKGLINGDNVALIFDGLQLHNNNLIDEELLEECRLYALEKTGYDVKLKIKPFDNQLELPNNYAEYEEDADALINKYLLIIPTFIQNNTKLLDDCIKEEGSHTTISKLTKALINDAIVYDEGVKNCWFYCNTNNIWKNSKNPFILKSILQNVVSDIFKNYSVNLSKTLKKTLVSEDINEDDSDEEKIRKKKLSNEIDEISLFNKLVQNKIKNCNTISLKLHNNSFINTIAENCQTIFYKEKFFQDYIDTNGDLFAFSDKVFDFKTNKIRHIKPNDYIMTNCCYKYPEYSNDDADKLLEKFFNQIYPNTEMKEFVLDTLTMMLWGNRLSQTFNIFCGSGSNGKSLLIRMLEMVLGLYYMSINPETLTKPKNGQNATSELYLAKGKRLIVSNEPENDKDNKLQTGLLKRMGGVGGEEKLKERGLYCDSVEFVIHFMLIILCNTKPELSSVDGGVGRRVRVVNHLMKFVEEPDPLNPYQALLDDKMYSIMTTENVRNAFIRMLLDRWVNKVNKIEKIKMPKQIEIDSIEYIECSNEVLGFIMDKYEITNNEKDKIQSSILFNFFKSKTNSKMTTGKFKDDMLLISGITSTKCKGIMWYRGLKQKDENYVDEDE